jgi:hypothetical protein
MEIMKQLRRHGILLFLMVLAAIGCGRGKGSVSGKVTYQGKPLTSGVVIFIDDKGRPSSPATIGKDGNYLAPRVSTGAMKVAVDNPPPPSFPKDKADDPTTKEARARAENYIPIPKKYKEANKSGLSFDVKPGPNVFDITLQ